MSKEIDLIKCIIFEIDKNLYSDFGGNLCISYTPDLKKLLLALNTPEVKYYFNNQDKQIADLQHRLEITETALKLACDNLEDINFKLYNTEVNFVDYFKEQAEKEVKGE